jgi:ATP-binding cassette, subfamily B, bacterial MsbA
MKEIKAIKTIFPLLKFYRWAIPVIIILGIIASSAEGIGMSLLIPFLQSLQPNSDRAVLASSFLRSIDGIFAVFPLDIRTKIIIGVILIAIFLKSLFSYFYTVLCHWLHFNVLHRLRCELFNRLIYASPAFWDKNKGGEILDTLTNRTEAACNGLSHFIWAIVDSCMIVVFTGILCLISWKLTILVSIAFVLISVITRPIIDRADKLGKENIVDNQLFQQLMLEDLTGVKTIQAFGREIHEQKQFARISKQVRNGRIQLQMLAATVEPISEGLAISVLLCLMLIALNSQISLPVLLTFIFMLYRLQPQVKKFDLNRLQFLAFSSSVKNVTSLLASCDRSEIVSGKIPFTSLQKEISFRSVSFSYEVPEKLALDRVSLAIPQGKTTAIVGYSGAGKSTLINLIFRFYDVTEGEICIDNHPLQQLDLASWRSRIAMVSQDIHLFNTTVKANIAYGHFEATEAEIIEAAKQANAHEFISTLPLGYDTPIGDRGIRLSGGQKQRLSIARAILCNPEILIFDEATNALDSFSESLVQEAINKLSQNRTVIIIAHRLSTIEKADRIFVMESGKVVEQGSFSNLIKLKGLFSRLYQLQYSGVGS